MQSKNKHSSWIDVYLFIKGEFCGKCNLTCCDSRRIICTEYTLFIIENWEIEQNEKNNY